MTKKVYSFNFQNIASAMGWTETFSQERTFCVTRLNYTYFRSRYVPLIQWHQATAWEQLAWGWYIHCTGITSHSKDSITPQSSTDKPA